MGYTTYVCSVCEHSYVGAITPPLGHDYENVVVAPTCTKEGYTEHTCARAATAIGTATPMPLATSTRQL